MDVRREVATLSHQRQARSRCARGHIHGSVAYTERLFQPGPAERIPRPRPRRVACVGPGDRYEQPGSGSPDAELPSKGVGGDRSAMLVPMARVRLPRPLQQIVVNQAGNCTAALPFRRALGLGLLPGRLRRRLPDSGRFAGERALHPPIAVGPCFVQPTCGGQRPQQIRADLCSPDQQQRSHGVERSFAVLACDERVGHV